MRPLHAFGRKIFELQLIMDARVKPGHDAEFVTRAIQPMLRRPHSLTAPGRPVSLFPPLRRGNGAPGGRRGVCETPFGQPLRSGRPRALRGRAPVCETGCAPLALHSSSWRSLRKLDCAAPIVGAPGPAGLRSRVMTALRSPAERLGIYAKVGLMSSGRTQRQRDRGVRADDRMFHACFIAIGFGTAQSAKR